MHVSVCRSMLAVIGNFFVWRLQFKATFAQFFVAQVIRRISGYPRNNLHKVTPALSVG